MTAASHGREEGCGERPEIELHSAGQCVCTEGRVKASRIIKNSPHTV